MKDRELTNTATSLVRNKDIEMTDAGRLAKQS
jgi:hypothetical protein